MAEKIVGPIRHHIKIKSVWETLDVPNPQALSGRGKTVRTERTTVELEFGSNRRIVEFGDVHTALGYAESNIPQRGYCWCEDYTSNEAKRYFYKDGQRGIAYSNYQDPDGVGYDWEWEAK